jgi:hypothetical protein
LPGAETAHPCSFLLLLIRSDLQRSNSYAPHDHRPDNRRRWWLIISLHYFLPFCRLRVVQRPRAPSLPFLTISLSFRFALDISVFFSGPPGVWRPKTGYGSVGAFIPMSVFFSPSAVGHQHRSFLILSFIFLWFRRAFI